MAREKEREREREGGGGREQVQFDDPFDAFCQTSDNEIVGVVSSEICLFPLAG